MKLTYSTKNFTQHYSILQSKKEHRKSVGSGLPDQRRDKIRLPCESNTIKAQRWQAEANLFAYLLK
jgi:hypothetical protein